MKQHSKGTGAVLFGHASPNSWIKRRPFWRPFCPVHITPGIIDEPLDTRTYTNRTLQHTRFIYCPGNCVVTAPSQVAVISGPRKSRMVIGECAFKKWAIGEHAFLMFFFVLSSYLPFFRFRFGYSLFHPDFSSQRYYVVSSVSVSAATRLAYEVWYECVFWCIRTYADLILCRKNTICFVFVVYYVCICLLFSFVFPLR